MRRMQLACVAALCALAPPSGYVAIATGQGLLWLMACGAAVAGVLAWNYASWRRHR